MRRREFISLLSGAAISWPIAVHAERPAHIPVIGFLGLGLASGWTGAVEALRQGLRDLGYVEGNNVVIEFRWADTADELPGFTAEFARTNVDIIVAPSSTQVEAARRVTKTIPIVFCLDADPVGMGHVVSLARPGGNITGLSWVLTNLVTKDLETLTEAVPLASRIGVLWNPTTPSHQLALEAIGTAGETLGVQITRGPARTVDDLEGAFSTMTREGVAGLLVVPSPLTFSQRAAVAALALKYRLPGMFGSKDEVEVGGLMSYGPNRNDLFRRVAGYIDKILKGAKPADLPVEQATKFELIVNLKTAKALGLKLPESFLVRADEVIE